MFSGTTFGPLTTSSNLLSSTSAFDVTSFTNERSKSITDYTWNMLKVILTTSTNPIPTGDLTDPYRSRFLFQLSVNNELTSTVFPIDLGIIPSGDS